MESEQTLGRQRNQGQASVLPLPSRDPLLPFHGLCDGRNLPSSLSIGPISLPHEATVPATSPEPSESVSRPLHHALADAPDTGDPDLGVGGRVGAAERRSRSTGGRGTQVPEPLVSSCFLAWTA